MISLASNGRLCTQQAPKNICLKFPQGKIDFPSAAPSPESCRPQQQQQGEKVYHFRTSAAAAAGEPRNFTTKPWPETNDACSFEQQQLLPTPRLLLLLIPLERAERAVGGATNVNHGIAQLRKSITLAPLISRRRQGSISCEKRIDNLEKRSSIDWLLAPVEGGWISGQ